MKNFLVILLILGLAVAGYAYYRVAGSSVFVDPPAETAILLVPENADYEQIKDSLRALSVRVDDPVFDQLAARMAYRRDRMRSGRFRIKTTWSALRLLRHLRGGAQEPVDVVLTTEREPMNVAAKVARFLSADSAAFQQLFQDRNYLDSIGYSKETLQSLFLPNTYEMYWNTSPRGFTDRMLREHAKFWDADNRRAKANKLNLDPAKAYTLASIVEKETQYKPERRRMAGVYLNRLKIGMPLQADPTAVFATRDFNVGRVLQYHTQFDSPYNTYKYAGLPPGPITMSSVDAIDAVLNAENHKYLFFCAAGDGTGKHNFAETLQGHARNIQIYVDNLRQRGLR
ncbi:MAG: endolytic transglycosylase MltG [Saprospiraceae bacterium]